MHDDNSNTNSRQQGNANSLECISDGDHMVEDMQVLLGSSLQPRAVCEHALATLRRFPCRSQALNSLQAFLEHPLTQKVLACDSHRLESFLSNDAYKPKMHNMYSSFLPGVRPVEFGLHVRRSPIPLRDIRDQDPVLWSAFQEACTRRLHVDPYPPAVCAALEQRFSGFKLHPAVLERQKVAYGKEGRYAELIWEEVDWGVGGSSSSGGAGGGCEKEEKELVAFATGSTLESTSHVETTLTQLVQEVTIAAQVRALDQDRKRSGRRKRKPISEEELLGNALARLAMGIDYLNYHYHLSQEHQNQQRGGDNNNSNKETNLKMILFAGRRSSSRRYLVLQNLYCCWNLDGFAGTSSILAATLLPQLEEEQKEQKDQKQSDGGKSSCLNKLQLVGTLAHEVPMALDQLLSSCSSSIFPISSSTKPSYYILQIAALLAHLLMLRSNGGLLSATALPDTFGTRGFLATALAAKLPIEFLEDMERLYPEEFATWKEKQQKLKTANDAETKNFDQAAAASSTVFDLFSIWRMDSGDYETMATAVFDAWKHRHHGLVLQQNQSDCCPVLFMHSNLGSYEEAAAVMKLPRHIRPSFLCFGTLADGFLPFEWEEKGDYEMQKGEIDENLREKEGGDLEELSEIVESAEKLRRELGLVPHRQPQRRSPRQPFEQQILVPPPVSKHVQLASVVMKVVQAKHPALRDSNLVNKMPCAAKLGDDYDSMISFSPRSIFSATEQNKMQLDPRLSVEEKLQVMQQLEEAAGATAAAGTEKLDEMHSEEVSAALAAAYRAVTREGLLS